MKNQYFGDINDYRKYGLLRILTKLGQIRTAVCWMLTPDDNRGDGGFTSYLEERDKWLDYDEDLFDHLKRCVLDRDARNVAEIENSGILPSCRFLSDHVPDDRNQRRAYFQRLMDLAGGCDLVFFDPDNGIEVKLRVGRKGSSKYLYWDEIGRFWKAGHSLLIYQHFPRLPRGLFIEAKGGELIHKTGALEVISFRTSHVVFFLLPQEERGVFFRARSEEVAGDWGRQIQVAYHCR